MDVKEIEVAVSKEMERPGSLLGNRALQKKIREVPKLNVPRNFAVMTDVNSDELRARGNVGIPKRPKETKRFSPWLDS